ncbi:FliM/FliN family flagellar motor switch protein [Porticoccaceae bacterium LTM1]|nr:FliM/FliN family flagellar motor switch protein [Porticoccaceae bacterium LTM1]
MINSDKSNSELGLILDIPVGLSVEVGSAQLTVREILSWKPDTIVTLDRSADDLMDVYVNNVPLATGEVVETDNHYGVRIVDVATPEERIRTLG